MTPQKPIKPTPPPPTPSPTDPSLAAAAKQANQGYSSLVSTAPSGLTRKADTVKRSLIGGT